LEELNVFPLDGMREEFNVFPGPRTVIKLENAVSNINSSTSIGFVGMEYSSDII
jgi:hypothetical protein